MKLPAFQFYPGDWMKNPDLRRCSHAARGVWIDMLCLMFECDERGVLATGSRPWSREDVAAAVGGNADVTLKCIDELIAKCVCKVRPDGTMYCQRMIDDEVKRVQNASRQAKHREKCDSNSKSNARVTRVSHPSSSSSSSSFSNGASNEAPPASDDGQKEKLRQPNPLWDVVAELWYGGVVAPPHRSRAGKLARDFKALNATPEDIRSRWDKYCKKWANITHQPEGLIKHWTQFGGPVASPAAPNVPETPIQRAMNYVNEASTPEGRVSRIKNTLRMAQDLEVKRVMSEELEKLTVGA